MLVAETLAELKTMVDQLPKFEARINTHDRQISMIRGAVAVLAFAIPVSITVIIAFL